MAMTGLDITPEQRKTLLALLGRFLPGVTVWAYGSRVQGTARRYSDLDLVAFASPEQRPRVAELKEALEESDLPFPVDLLIWDELPERFRPNIEKWHVVVQEGNGKAASFRKVIEKERVVTQTGNDEISNIDDRIYQPEWPVSPLSVAIGGDRNTIAGGPFGSNLTQKDYVSSGVPVIRGGNMGVGSRFIGGEFVFVTDEKADRLSTNLASPGDIIVAQFGFRGLIRPAVPQANAIAVFLAPLGCE